MGNSDDIKAEIKTEERFRSGANWFYWIAGLSIVNSVIMLAEGSVNFPVGLGITQIIDSITTESGGSAKGIGFIFDILIALVFVFFGAMARKKHIWSFYAGMGIYACDALLFLLVEDWFGIVFHVFALFGMKGGLAAANTLKKSPQLASPLADDSTQTFND